MEKKEPNPYMIAFITAIMSGAISIVGNFIIINKQLEQALFQKVFDERTKAYSDFLRKSKFSDDDSLGKLYRLYPIFAHATSDADYRDYFIELEKISSNLEANILFDKTANDLAILHVYGSKEVIQICEDLRVILLSEPTLVKIEHYPKKIQLNNEKLSMQFTPWDKKSRIGMFSALYYHLISVLSNELRINT